jgi:poly-gamma-glutamate system protein
MHPARPLLVSVLGLASLGVLALAIAERTRHPVEAPYHDEKLAAARLTAQAHRILREERWGPRPILDTVNDPNETGLIGEEFTLITTDRGVLGAKLTSLNPNFGALVVGFLRDAGFGPGDLAAVNMTGSFPALNAAVLAAIESIGGRAVAITSVGASMWGANDPDFTWLDMERVLVERGVLHTRSVAASLGGGEDRGRGLSPEGRRLLREAAARNGIPLIEEPTLEDSIARRMDIFEAERGTERYRVCVNVGGGLASLGATQNGRLLVPGLSREVGLHNFPRRGVAILMAERGVPLVHLLEVEQLAREHGLPTAPVPLPEPGDGEIFAHEDYHRAGVSLVLIAYLALVPTVLHLSLRESAKRRSQ